MYGTTLKQLRLIYNYNSKELAEKLNISPSYLSEIENNKKNPSIKILDSYSEVFNIKLSTLILLFENENNLSFSKKFISKIITSLIENTSSFIDNDEGDNYDE